MESEEADDLGVDVPGKCEWCGEDTVDPLEECPACGKFLCNTCENIHCCDDRDMPPDEEDEDDGY